MSFWQAYMNPLCYCLIHQFRVKFFASYYSKFCSSDNSGAVNCTSVQITWLGIRCYSTTFFFFFWTPTLEVWVQLHSDFHALEVLSLWMLVEFSLYLFYSNIFARLWLHVDLPFTYWVLWLCQPRPFFSSNFLLLISIIFSIIFINVSLSSKILLVSQDFPSYHYSIFQIINSVLDTPQGKF